MLESQQAQIGFLITHIQVSTHRQPSDETENKQPHWPSEQQLLATLLQVHLQYNYMLACKAHP